MSKMLKIKDIILNLPDTTKNIVYCAIHKSDNKLYIGISTMTLRRRILLHKKAIKYKKDHFHYALKKYGLQNFNWYILFQHNSKKRLLIKEKELIKLFHSNNRLIGYNTTNGGEHPNFTDEIKMKISKAKTGKCGGKNNPFYGQHHSEELKIYFSKIRKGKNIGTKNPFYGKKHTKKTKKLIGISKIGKRPWNAQTLFCIELNKQFSSLEETATYFKINAHKLSEYLKKDMSYGIYHFKRD